MPDRDAALCDPAAVRVSAKPCGRTGHLKEIKGNVSGRADLPLDYDPDVSFANIENRLQMLIMNAKNEDAEAESKA